MNKKLIVSQEDVKYKNGRMSLLIIVICSALNIILPVLLGSYFLFSAYIPMYVADLGYYMYVESGEMLLWIIGIIIGFITLVPYVLCFIFSKKKVGWMIDALVMLGLDTLFFIPDFIFFMANGELSALLDLAFHIYALVTLIMGVVAGTKAEKQARPEFETSAADVGVDVNVNDSLEGDTSSPFTRTLILVRPKAYAACAVKFVFFVNGSDVCTLKNGETSTLTVTGNSFELSAAMANGLGSTTVTVPAGTADISYTLVVKMGMTAANISLIPTPMK